MADNEDDRRHTGVALLANFISNAFDEKRRFGSSSNYDYMLQQLTTETSFVVLKRWLRALTQCVSAIARSNYEVVDAVLAIPWTFADTAFGNVYMDFVDNLVSANAYYTAPCVHMLMLNMTYRSEVPNAPRPPTGLTDVERNEMYNRVHQALFSVLNIVPTSMSLLVPIFGEFFPHKRQSTLEHVWFMRNLLKTLDYVPEIMSDVLGMIFDHLIQIDVEIQVDLDDVEDENEDDSFTEDDDELSLDEDGMEDDDAADALSQKKAVRRLADKLDQMLYITLDFLERSFKQFEKPNQKALLELILGHFERTIMTTHKSRYTQFVIFFVSSWRSEFPDVFLSYLIHILMDSQKSLLLRQSAAAYIAGTVCRSKRVSIDATMRCLDLMFQWAHSYIDHIEESVVVPDQARFGLFYYVCQAMFYIFCFRHRQLMAMSNGTEYFQGLGFSRIVESRFNPLKVCMPSVVHEFARITEHYQLLYCWTIIQRNKRIIQPMTADGSVDSPIADFESFFVFEPFRLKLSSRFVDSYYQEWEEGTGDDDDSSSNQSFMDSEDEDTGSESGEQIVFDITAMDTFDNFETMRELGLAIHF